MAQNLSSTVDIGNNVGAVVGRGGSHINAIQAQSGAQVNIDDNVCTVSGTTEQMAAAKELIAEYIEHNGPKPNATCTLTVGDEGKFIVLGPKGKTIRALQDDTGARLNLEGSTLSISGPSHDVVTKAIAAVTQLLNENSNTETVSLGTERGAFGAVIGKAGVNIRRIQDTSGSRIKINRGEGTETLLEIKGTKEAIARAKQMIKEAIEEENGPPKPAAGEVIESVQLGASTGSVIGKGGSNVTKLQTETGAKLTVKNGICYIVGKKDAVAKAKTAVDAIVDKDLKFAAAREAVNEAPAPEWTPEDNLPDDAPATGEEWGGASADGW